MVTRHFHVDTVVFCVIQTWTAMCSHSQGFYAEEPIHGKKKKKHQGVPNKQLRVWQACLSRKPQILIQNPKEGSVL